MIKIDNLKKQLADEELAVPIPAGRHRLPKTTIIQMFILRLGYNTYTNLLSKRLEETNVEEAIGINLDKLVYIFLGRNDMLKYERFSGILASQPLPYLHVLFIKDTVDKFGIPVHNALYYTALVSSSTIIVLPIIAGKDSLIYSIAEKNIAHDGILYMPDQVQVVIIVFIVTIT